MSTPVGFSYFNGNWQKSNLNNDNLGFSPKNNKNNIDFTVESFKQWIYKQNIYPKLFYL